MLIAGESGGDIIPQLASSSRRQVISFTLNNIGAPVLRNRNPVFFTEEERLLK